ncbi:hypothetical protein RUND412_007847 [Rhizina undulata]
MSSYHTSAPPPTTDPGIPPPTFTSSFWHSEPNPFLYHHRTTPTPPKNADIVIIGSGISGAMTARHLYERSKTPPRIVMLEAREACWGATGRNGGHCKPALYAYCVFNSLCQDLGVEETLRQIRFQKLNLELLREYIARERIEDECEFKYGGSCDAYYKRDTFEVALENIAGLRKVAPDLAAELEIVDGSTAEGRQRLRDELRIPTAVGAVVFKAAKLWPYKLVADILVKCIQQHGLNLQTTTPALEIGRSRENTGGRWTVLTPSRKISADRVIFATNAHTAHLLPVFEGYIYPVRAQMAALKPPRSLLERPLTHTYGLVRNQRKMAEYLIQRPVDASTGEGGELMLGGGRFLAKGLGVGQDDGSVDEDVAQFLRGAIAEYFAGEEGFPGEQESEWGFDAASDFAEEEENEVEDKASEKEDPGKGMHESHESLVERFQRLTLNIMGNQQNFWDAAEGFGFDTSPPPTPPPEQSGNQLQLHPVEFNVRTHLPSTSIPPPAPEDENPENEAENEADEMQKMMETIVPRRQELISKADWTGVMGFSKDERPFVGRVPAVSKNDAEQRGIQAMENTDGLWMLAGFEGHGMAYTTGSAKALVEMMLVEDDPKARENTNKTIYDWFPRTFEVTPERLGLLDERSSADDEKDEWVVV